MSEEIEEEEKAELCILCDAPLTDDEEKSEGVCRCCGGF